MQRRHENALSDLLERVAHQGYAGVPKWQITRWYTQQHFSVNVRRDLRERWDNMLDDLGWADHPTLRIAELNGDIVLMRKTDFFPDKE